MTKTFTQELDIALLADVLHDSKCNGKHLNTGQPINPTFPFLCDYYTHNSNIALSNRVNEAQKKTKYYQQAKQVYEMCEGMNTKDILKLVKLINEN